MGAGFEVHFLDVGQGSSSVILYPSGKSLGKTEAVVIDGGPQGTRVTATVLNDFADFVRAIFLTHNHVDHLGGALPVIRTWAEQGKLGDIYFVNDRTAGARKLAYEFENEENAGRLSRSQLHWLDQGDVYRFPSSSPLFEVRVLAPTKNEAMRASGANETSAVLRLAGGGARVLFCGDSTREVWERIVADSGREPLVCDAVTAPHHGGHFADPPSPDDSRWFFTEAVQAKVAIFSFGASNPYNHPQRQVLKDAKSFVGCEAVLCTQVHPDLNTPPYNGTHGITPVTPYSQSWNTRSQKGTDRRHHYACAGSITLRLGPGEVEWGNGGDPDPICGFRSIREFQRAVERLLKQSEAQCPPCPWSGAH